MLIGITIVFLKYKQRGLFLTHKVSKKRNWRGVEGNKWEGRTPSLLLSVIPN